MMMIENNKEMCFLHVERERVSAACRPPAGKRVYQKMIIHFDWDD